MIRTKEVQELMQSIEGEGRQAVNKENMFDNSVRIYLVIKSLYQNYKRKNVLELMQERIFELKLPESGSDKYKLTNVSAANIFEYHDLCQDDLLLLIEMKEYLKQDIKAELYGEIFEGIDKLTQVREVMTCYKSFLNLQYFNKKRDIYSSIEQRMLAKLISMPLAGKDFKIIARYLISLPLIKQPILILISQLYDKVAELKDFTDLFKIFENNYPPKPTPTDIQALIKISLDETLASMLKIIEGRGQLSDVVLKIAEKQAKFKLQSMPLIMTSKTKAILNFIIQVVKLGRPIWHEIIEWQHKAAQQPKNFLKQKLESILIEMLKDNKNMEVILSIIEKITEIDQHSEIGLIFVRELLKLSDREYLSHKIIRRFLAIKILKYNSSEEYVKQIFGSGTQFIEVILEMFNFELPLVLNFYLNIIRSEDSLRMLDAYLKELAEKLPIKYKELYLRCNAIDRVDVVPTNISSTLNAVAGNMSNNVNSHLLKLLEKYTTFQIAVSLTRDLALIFPSKHLINILTKFLANFKESKQISVLRMQVARTLNLVLIRTAKEQINSAIKINLPNIIKEHLMEESKLIFENVPSETIESLKKSYDEYVKRKM